MKTNFSDGEERYQSYYPIKEEGGNAYVKQGAVIVDMDQCKEENHCEK